MSNEWKDNAKACKDYTMVIFDKNGNALYIGAHNFLDLAMSAMDIEMKRVAHADHVTIYRHGWQFLGSHIAHDYTPRLTRSINSDWMEVPA